MASKVKLDLSNIQDKQINNLITDISTLSLNESDKEDVLLDDDKLYEIIFDMDNSEDLRIRALDRYNDINQEYIIEIINRLNSMYIFSYTKILESYISNIVYKSKIDPVLKLESAKVLTDNTEKGYDCIDYICRKYVLLPTPSRVDGIVMLMKCEKYKLESLKYFTELVNDKTIDNFYRYKCILNLENNLQKESIIYFMVPILKSFMKNTENITRVRILACQYVIKQFPDLYELSVSTLFSFGNDNQLDYNLRADAVDVLLRIQDEDIISRARNILLELAREGKVIRTIYDNAQNVHSEAIEDSAIAILEEINMCCKNIYTFDDVRNVILTIIENEDYDKNKREKIEMSLTRIYLDRGVYGKFNISLMGILCKVWNFINTQEEHRAEMINRLLDELYDASDVCSTGYAFRILNTLSGFTNYSIKISFEDQIVSNLQGRLNSRIRQISDSEYMFKILEEMIIDTHLYHMRGNFLKFFRENIPSIRQEMYEEFKDYMEDTDYDLYFRKAIFKYEGIE